MVTSTTFFTVGDKMGAHSKNWFQVSVILAFAPAAISQASADSALNSWIGSEGAQSAQLMLRNVSAPGATPGSVIAAPTHNPNYYYHWVRDAGLTMDTIVTLYKNAQSSQDQARYFQFLSDYAEFSRSNQRTNNRSGGADSWGLGEPKFNVDGSTFDGDWGRPQNDGPAIRASTLIRLAQDILAGLPGSDDSKIAWVKQKLYDSNSPSNSVIKVDLDFVAQHWRDTSFDLWEEVKGTHFFTRMMQRKALVMGAALASQLGDSGSASRYLGEVSNIEGEIQRHWDSYRGQINTTIDWTGGMGGKDSGLDSATIIAVLRGATDDGFFGVTDDRVFATSEKIRLSFKDIYSINQTTQDFNHQPMGVAIGRYPEDSYDGSPSRGQGNPWFLSTNAFAEYYYDCAKTWQKDQQITLTDLNVPVFRSLRAYTGGALQPGTTLRASDPRFAAIISALRAAGDDMLRRVHYHADGSGAISEQFNRYNGFMQSAENLTWSYASILTAFGAR
jgi:glucoamylase